MREGSISLLVHNHPALNEYLHMRFSHGGRDFDAFIPIERRSMRGHGLRIVWFKTEPEASQLRF